MRGNESYAGLRLQEQIVAVFVQLHQETLHVAIEVLRVETDAVCQVRVVHSAVIARKGDGICFGLFRVDRQREMSGSGSGAGTEEMEIPLFSMSLIPSRITLNFSG